MADVPADAQPNVQALLQRLEWTVLKRLDGALQGDYRTLLRGHGVDLADLREYQEHDDVRHIDWNVTARTNTLHVASSSKTASCARGSCSTSAPRSISARARGNATSPKPSSR